MPSYKNYTTEQYNHFLSLLFSDNFGYSEDEAAEWFMKQAGAKPVINSYSVTKEMLVNSLIPKMKEYLEGGYMCFLIYTVTEGGGAGNWINHYMTDQASDAMGTLVSDLEYIVSIVRQFPNLPVAMTAPEVAGQPPQENINEAQAVYESLKNWSIGAIIMPSTMAGNAWVYSENWCLQHQGSSAPSVYFGNPYNQFISVIQSTGIDPFTYTNGGATSTQTAKAQTKASGNKANNTSDNTALLNSILKDFKDIINKLLKEYENQLSNKGQMRLYSNEVLTTLVTLDNTLVKNEISEDFIKSLIDNFSKKLNNYKVSDVKPDVKKAETKNSGEEKTNESSTAQASNELSDKVKNAIATIRGLRGVTVGDGQCYALSGYYAWLIDGKDISYSNKHQMRGLTGATHPELSYPFSINGYSASKIYVDWNWDGWSVKVQPENQDIKIGAIYCVGSNYGGIWVTGGAGHTGVITGLDDVNVEITEQNYLGQPVVVRQLTRDSFINGIEALIYPN